MSQKIVGKPYAGKPHVRVERGWGNRAAQRHRRPEPPVELHTLGEQALPDVLAAITATR